MTSEIVLKVLDCFQEIEESLPIAANTILQNDEMNILAGIHFSKIEITEKQRMGIIAKISKIKKYFEINHIIIAERVILFQGSLKK